MITLIAEGAAFIVLNYTFRSLIAYPENRVICIDSLTYAGNLTTFTPKFIKIP